MKYNLPRIQRTLYSFLATVVANVKSDLSNSSLLFPRFTFDALGELALLGTGAGEPFSFSLGTVSGTPDYTFTVDPTAKSVYVTSMPALVTYIYRNGDRVIGTSDISDGEHATDPFISAMFVDVDEMDLTAFGDNYYIFGLTPAILTEFAKLSGVGLETHYDMVIDYFNDEPDISILWGMHTPGMFNSSELQTSNPGKYYLSVDGEGYYYAKCTIPSPLSKQTIYKGEPVFLDKVTNVFTPGSYMGEANALVLDDCPNDYYCMVQMVSYEMNPPISSGGTGAATIIKSGGNVIPAAPDGSVEINGGNLVSDYYVSEKKVRSARNASKTK